MFEIDLDRVFFVCDVCNYIFQDDPFKMPVRCPMCGSEKVSRI